MKNNIPTKSIDEFKNLISNISDNKISKEKTIEKLNRTINKENIDDTRKISKIKAQNLAANLLNYFNIDISEKIISSPTKLKKLFENEKELDEKFKSCLKDEKRIFSVIDNFSAHKTYLSKLICKMLNIKLIFLPKYSPFLNPIEQLWRVMKNIIHRNTIFDLNLLKQDVAKNFYDLVDNESFTEVWIGNYIAKNRCPTVKTN